MEKITENANDNIWMFQIYALATIQSQSAEDFIFFNKNGKFFT